MPFTYTQATTVLGSVLSIGVGFIDAKTGSTFGVVWDASLITFGLGALVGVAVPAVAAKVAP